MYACADPESFVRGGPTMTMFFCFVYFSWWGEGGYKYHYKRAIIGLPTKRHLMAFHWRADDGPTLNAGMVAAIFQGIQICIARKPINYVTFQEGSGPSVTPSGSAHVYVCIMYIWLIMYITGCLHCTWIFQRFQLPTSIFIMNIES